MDQLGRTNFRSSVSLRLKPACTFGHGKEEGNTYQMEGTGHGPWRNEFGWKLQGQLNSWFQAQDGPHLIFARTSHIESVKYYPVLSQSGEILGVGRNIRVVGIQGTRLAEVE